VRLIAAACAGFLLAVLWMDLIFDSQVLRHRGADVLPEPVLDSISRYYHRATTTSRPAVAPASSAESTAAVLRISVPPAGAFSVSTTVVN